MYLENQSEEGKEINKALIEEITHMASEDSSRVKLKPYK